MIVISGALVLVALVLLVLGLTMTDLDFVYGSIGVSLVSFVFLVIGILQRRGEPSGAAAPTVSDDAAQADEKAGEPAAAATPAPVGASGRPLPQHVPAVTTADGARAPRTSGPAAVVEEVDDEELLPGGGPVLVVEGRPRYHVEGCRYLTGRTVEELDVLDARDDGFTACGVCKPDQVLEELYGPIDEVAAEPDEVDEPVLPAAEPVEAQDDDVLDTGVPGAGDDEPAPVTARRGRAAGSAKVDLDKPAAPAKAKAPAKAAKAKAPAKTPAKTPKTPAAKTAAATTAPAKTAAAKATPAKAAAAAEPAAAAAPAASARGKVVVIPDRDRFHVATCRFVRDADGTEQLTRAQAGKQGYRPCGVCKP